MNIRVFNNKCIRVMLLAVTAMLCLASCGDDDETYTQSVTLSAKGEQQTVTLTNLSARITSVANSNSWLKATADFYNSGSPSLTLSATENTEKSERNGVVTITAESGDKVVLTVTQQAASEEEQEGTGIDDTHNSQSDQPAYGRTRSNESE